MQKTYYAVTREGTNDLQHWKYIKKKKVKGKWKYYYQNDAIDKKGRDKYDHGITRFNYRLTEDREKIITQAQRKYKNRFGLKNRTKVDVKTNSDGSKITKITYERGLIDRIRTKGEKFIYDKFLKNKTPGSSKMSKAIKQGETFVNSIKRKLTKNKKTDKPVKYMDKPVKYLEKIKMPNGKSKYIYKDNKKEKQKGKIDYSKVVMKKKNPLIDGYYGIAKLPNGKSIQFYDKESYDDYAKLVKYQKDEPDFLKDIKEIDSTRSYMRHANMRETNPKFDVSNKDYSWNCFRCSLTYEMRMRGYDVEATAYERNNQSTVNLHDCFENVKVHRVNRKGDAVDITNDTKSESKYYNLMRMLTKKPIKYKDEDLSKAVKQVSPPGSRGIIHNTWSDADGAGHSMIYEVDTKGKVIIRDAQTGKREMTEFISAFSEHLEIIRTDNLKPKKKILRYFN